MIKNILFPLFLLLASAASAQQVMNLQECLRIGLENNYDLRIVRNEELISDNNVTLGNAGFLPEV
ncbi:MAG: TolC family protein, partial [Proteiniphilum sp.]